MAYTLDKLLSFESFLAQYGDDFRYELVDGELVEMEPTGPHEMVAGKIAMRVAREIDRLGYSWFVPKSCILRPFTAGLKTHLELNLTIEPSEGCGLVILAAEL